MRLRLTVKRHGLPDTRVIWHVDIGSSPTIFQLLERVNETIPIESCDQWGLEDYAVELKGSIGTGFECLHFQEVGKVMKEDDEVIIRPLLARDLKIRRISGRHQISADGKHLVDGIAFGRPLLRVSTGRPQISIPPRKRPKFTITDDDGDSEGSAESSNNTEPDDGNKQLARYCNLDDDDSEDDGDFVPEEFEGSDEDEDEDYTSLDDGSLVGELKDHDRMDISCGGQASSGHNEEIPKSIAGPGEITMVADVDASDGSDRSRIRKLHAAFPKASLGLCKHVYRGADGDMGASWEALNHGFRAVMPKSAISGISHGESSHPKRKSRSISSTNFVHGDVDSMDISTEEHLDPVISYYDQNGLPPGSIASRTVLSVAEGSAKHNPNQHPPKSSRSTSVRSKKSLEVATGHTSSTGINPTPGLDRDPLECEDSLTSDSSEDTSEECTSTSGSSDSSSSESSESDSSDESSGGDSQHASSSDGDEPEEVSSKSAQVTLHSIEQPRLRPASDGKSKMIEARPPVQPTCGKKKTQMRNARRRRLNALHKRSATEVSGLDTNMSVEVKAVHGKRDEEIEQRREELLAALASGGIEVGQSPPKKALKALVTEAQPSQLEIPPVSLKANAAFVTAPEALHPTSTLAKTIDPSNIDLAQARQTEVDIPKAAPTPTDALLTKEPPSRRTKLDLGAGRRLLFGALGMKTPKTRKDEEKARSDLMQNVKRISATRAEEQLVPDAHGDAEAKAEDHDPEAWRGKIIYRAVECCHDGICLSEPPFPFQQRWDPQQQSSWSHTGNRGGKRKKNQRDQPRYYDDPPSSKKRKGPKNTHDYAEKQEHLDPFCDQSHQDGSTSPRSDEFSEMKSAQHGDLNGEASQQLPNNIHGSSSAGSQEPDDLVPLPADIFSLPDLQKGHAKVGTIIAFKQIVMSAETNWQPQISPYRTAIVTNVSGNCLLDLTLAKRDRLQSDKVYDEETGVRIYGKFDMPVDGDEDEEDDGRLALSFDLLIEPKVVMNALMDTSQDAIDDMSQQAQLGMEEPISLGCRQPSHGASGSEEHVSDRAVAQLSHVTETQLTSEAVPTPLLSQNEHSAAGSNITYTQGSVNPHQAGEAIVDTNERADGQYGIARPRTPDLNTPLKSVNPGSIDVAPSAGGVSEENRQEISHMIKEAGFRSSIPSSFLRDIHPHGVESPGDAAVFEKLLKDMADIEKDATYSPRFSGLESSPPRGSPEASPLGEPESLEPSKRGRSTPSIHSLQPSPQAQRPLQSSWYIIDRREHEEETPNGHCPPSDKEKLGDSDEGEYKVAEGDDFDVGKIEPILEWDVNPQQEATRRAAGPNVRATNQPLKAKSVKASLVPVSKAQAIWDQLHARSSSNSLNSHADCLEPVSTGSDAVEDRQSNASVQYPKLSKGSSFTSQVTDHGRQPDFNFDDSPATNPTTLKVSNFDEVHISPTDAVPEPSNRRRDSASQKVIQTNGTIASAPLAQKSVKPRLASSTNSSGRAEEPSDDDFPPLEDICSQPLPRNEKLSPARIPRGDKQSVTVALGTILSETSDGSTPKLSRKQNQRSSSQESRRHAFQRDTSQSQFVLPQGSQVMDLTVSSDEESEPVQASESEDVQPRRFRRYDLDGDDDDPDYDRGEQALKEEGSLRGVKKRRRTGIDVKRSSKSSLNKNKRTTTTTS